jgi:HSP20 family molecular chaperone IbpA
MLRHSASMPRLCLYAPPKRNFAKNLSFMSVEEPLGRETYDQNPMPQWKSGLSTEEFSFLEGDHSFTVSANLSGFKKEDLKVYVDQNYMLCIEGEHKGSEITDDGWSLNSSNRFHRFMPLPPNTDPSALAFSVENGMLNVVLPKAHERK